MEKVIKRFRPSKNGKRVALTFDDGPDPYYTPRILKILRENNIKATFFVLGRKVQCYPHLVKQIIEEGHDIGNHTFSHPLFCFSAGQIKREITATNMLLKKIIGSKPKLFRTPGIYFPHIRRKIERFASQCGHIPVSWTRSAKDWLNSRSLIRGAVLKKEIADGEIILMHDGTSKSLFTRRDALVDLLPAIVKKFRKDKITLIPLTEVV